MNHAANAEQSILIILCVLLLAPLAMLRAGGTRALNFHHADGQEESLSRIEELQPMLARTTAKGDLRLVVKGVHKLHEAIHLALHPGQRLVIEGEGSDALFDLGELPLNEAAICFEAGQFELRNIGMRKGPAWSVLISSGVNYHLFGLRISDSRGGGIVVWGPSGLDQSGPGGNRIEKCVVERFNTAKAKWTHDAISVRDNGVVITRNIVRDSPTETMGIRIMGAGNRIEGNLVKNVAAGDAGGIYLWGGEAIYTAVGNVVRNNIVVGASRGIYLDDGTCAARVEQNYLVDCREAALFIGGGRDNRLDQNVALRCPILAHLDNRRTGWRDLPEKAAMFAAARFRLAKALEEPGQHSRIVASGLDVGAFESLGEEAFNEPDGNFVTRSLLMPPAQELRWQNYAHPEMAFSAEATDPARPNRMAQPLTGDWRTLSGDDQMPSVPQLMKALPSQ